MPTEIRKNNIEPLDQTLNVGNTTAIGQFIESISGGGFLNLRFGVDGLVVLANDNTAVFGALQIDKANKQILISQGDGITPLLWYIEVTDNNIGLKHTSANAYSAIDAASIEHTDISNQNIGTVHGIAVFEADADRFSNGGTQAVIINSGNNPSISTYKAFVSRSVILGGQGITAKTNDTAYINQLSFQFPGNTFDSILRGSAATQDNTATLQNDSGTIAFLKNIPVATYAENLDSAVASITRVFAGGRTTFTVTHNLNSLDIKPQIYRLSDLRNVGWRIERVNVNVIEVSRAGNVADGLFRVII